VRVDLQYNSCLAPARMIPLPFHYSTTAPQDGH
jgi:hypothetical protein